MYLHMEIDLKWGNYSIFHYVREKLMQKLYEFLPLKSVNLQYNMLVCWDAGTKDSSTKRLMFQFVIFTISCKILFKIVSIYFFIIFYNKDLWMKYWKKNTRCLVNESFVPASQRTSGLYCRLTDFIASIVNRPDKQLLKPIYVMVVRECVREFETLWPKLHLAQAWSAAECGSIWCR